MEIVQCLKISNHQQNGWLKLICEKSSFCITFEQARETEGDRNNRSKFSDDNDILTNSVLFIV